ncbi:hypothetical protein H312_00673 [Anncaliia algerae PRA339]|uniref:Histone-binding protein RBBP4-like N-terminal domain-containing protein n=1 Tax=Anncaliia algerae PRA339 TaxID=1288291 RepID=A0A059F478_9MICR|nr:hypothetical protein H312_00673 [Anncaliia algerae PRA339]
MIDETKVIQAEYMVWRKNIQTLYSMVLNHSIEWPALSIQYYPDYTRHNNQTTQRLLISPHTSGQDQEYLLIVEITLPDSVDDAETGDNFKFKIVQKIALDVEVNRARYSYLSPNMIAVRSDDKDVLIFDSTKHLSNEKKSKPDYVLKGHEAGGFGLDWSFFESNLLLSCGEDKKIVLNDISNESFTVFEGHKGIINDINFSKINHNIFLSVGDNKQIFLWDKRVSSAIKSVEGHMSDVLCCEFNPLEENICATGAADSSLKIWDIRNMDKEIFNLTGHKKEVSVVRWSPHSSSVLASGSYDRRVILWDMKRNDYVDQEAPSEMLFIHGGHTNVVTDISWNPLEKFEIASTAEDNVIQIWAKADESV